MLMSWYLKIPKIQINFEILIGQFLVIFNLPLIYLNFPNFIGCRGSAGLLSKCSGLARALEVGLMNKSSRFAPTLGATPVC
jgi:hypothetical protein